MVKGEMGVAGTTPRLGVAVADNGDDMAGDGDRTERVRDPLACLPSCDRVR